MQLFRCMWDAHVGAFVFLVTYSSTQILVCSVRNWWSWNLLNLALIDAGDWVLRYCHSCSCPIFDCWNWMEFENLPFIMWWKNMGVQLECFVLWIESKWTVKEVEIINFCMPDDLINLFVRDPFKCVGSHACIWIYS